MLCTVGTHMSRRIFVAALLAALTLAGAGVPGLAPPASAASCSSWTSESEPPPTIRVFRHASGAVDTVDFRTYTKNVLSREWIGSWTAESLRSGALAVKSYAWYQVLHWRGGTNSDGACFDLRDDTWDQVYDPTKATWSTAAAAVDATWATRVLKNGRIFPTYYNAGAPLRGLRRERERLEGVAMGHPGVRPRRQERCRDHPHLLLPRRHRDRCARARYHADAHDFAGPDTDPNANAVAHAIARGNRATRIDREPDPSGNTDRDAGPDARSDADRHPTGDAHADPGRRGDAAA